MVVYFINDVFNKFWVNFCNSKIKNIKIKAKQKNGYIKE